ncbi:SCP-like extracellular [Haloterrigena turkmenica DSM 5511]|uniref:SCP-like extracellular n=1 Tax=Haloterrigena turkmenica (strain ATCC 51198 / DSM 5511 / JCM 9101 / NCIMB 13204 / VKM B-1734 / 4k) TaxID=543526 RepID=D2RWB9_HALTV|nr:CAP domain-containing protein [Haloterrigena turkmenica]ADB59508.1 SCP-like extracellular [Haloterrigena turkmenica DSM 5511]
MKLQSITAVVVVALLSLSMVGAGAAAPAASPVEDTSTETDTDTISQSDVVTQSDVTTISSVTSGSDGTVEVNTDGVDGVESLVGDLDSGQAGDATSVLESLFSGGITDNIDDEDTPGDADDGTDETNDDTGDGADETDGDESSSDNETDETDDNETDETDSDDETDETDSDETDGNETNETAGDETDDTADDETDDGSSDEIDRAALERYVHEAVNEERTARGLEPLEFDTELRDIARAHSEDMAERGYFAHVDPEGNDVTDRYEQAGYECNANGYTGGENLAQTWYDTPVVNDDGETVRYETEQELADGIVTQWMNSPDHRENLLATQWENEGIGVYVTDDNRVFVTQNFC